MEARHGLGRLPHVLTVESPDPDREVTLQLGRCPAIEYEVAVRCPWGRPTVLACEPFTRTGHPNPNLFYLSCPYLRRELARMEDRGAISALEQRIKSEPGLAQDLKRAQAAHRHLWQKMSDRFRKAIRGKAEPEPQIAPPNIAAAGKELKLKCLHAHVAWFLVHSRHRVGEEIVTMMEAELWCPDDECQRLVET